MDPTIGLIVTAIATGAAAALKPTAEQAIKDAYAALKGLVQRKYGKVDVTPLEEKPGSAAKRDSLAEDLVGAGANADEELRQHAERLIELIEKSAPATPAAVGIDLEKVKAAYLKVDRIKSDGTGLRGRELELRQGIDIGTVDAGMGRKPKNQQRQ